MFQLFFHSCANQLNFRANFVILNNYFPNFETNSQGGQNKLEHCFYFMTKWNLFELR